MVKGSGTRLRVFKMVTRKEKQLQQQVNWAYWIAGQAYVVPLCLGGPGTAKSASCAALAKAAGRNYEAYFLDQEVPENLGGYKAIRPREIGGVHRDVMASIHDERFLRCTYEPSVLLMDELTNAGGLLQASALKVVNDGIPGTWIFAAANPPEQASNGTDLTPPMVNRLCVLDWELDKFSILDGWRNGLNFPDPCFPLLPENWKEFHGRWGVLLAKFVEFFPQLFNAFPKDLAQACNPYPTPRSWTNCIKLLGAAESVNASPETSSKLIYGCVGQPAGSQFLEWVEKQDLPDPEELLANPSSLKLPSRGDLAVAVMASVFNRLRDENSGDRWEAARDILECAYGQFPEIATAAEGGLWKIKPQDYSPKKREGDSLKKRNLERVTAG